MVTARLAVIGVLVASGAAAAAPLAQKWRVAGCPEATTKRTATELVYADRAGKTIVRRDLATGAPLPALRLAAPMKRAYVADTAGDALVLANAGTYVAVDAATGKQRWTVKGTREVRLGDDLAVASEPKGKVTVQRITGASGEKAWSVDVPRPGKGALYSFATDGAHVLIGITDEKAPAFTVTVLDGKTGAVAWTSTLPIATYHGAILGGGAVVVEEKTQGGSANAFHILDAATGKVVGTVEYANAFAPAVGPGRLYVGHNDLATKQGALVAIDTRTAKPVWTVATQSVGALEGLGAGGLVVETGGNTLRVFDVATGKQLSVFGAPQRANVALAERGGPAITLCDGKELLALEPGGTEETAKVTGTVACKSCEATTLPVRIGDATGTTDARGAFSLTLVGAGRYELEVPLEENGGIIGGTGSYVQLTGKGAYDLGAIKVAQPALGD